MRRRLFLRGSGLFLTLGLVALPLPCLARDPGIGNKAIQQDRVVAGGPKDFLEVRHVVLKGSNEDIGRALATLARERFQAKPLPSSDRLRTRVQRRYIERHYPILFERMRGVAGAFGGRLDDDA